MEHTAAAEARHPGEARFGKSARAAGGPAAVGKPQVRELDNTGRPTLVGRNPALYTLVTRVRTDYTVA